MKGCICSFWLYVWKNNAVFTFSKCRSTPVKKPKVKIKVSLRQKDFDLFLLFEEAFVRETEVHSEPKETSKAKHFAKEVNCC